MKYLFAFGLVLCSALSFSIPSFAFTSPVDIVLSHFPLPARDGFARVGHDYLIPLRASVSARKATSAVAHYVQRPSQGDRKAV